MSLAFVRYVLPALLVVAGFVIPVRGRRYVEVRWLGDVHRRRARALLPLNFMFRYRARGDREREAEEAAREHFARHRRVLTAEDLDVNAVKGKRSATCALRARTRTRKGHGKPSRGPAQARAHSGQRARPGRADPVSPPAQPEVHALLVLRAQRPRGFHRADRRQPGRRHGSLSDQPLGQPRS